MEGSFEVTGIRGRRRKLLLYLMETRRYWKLKEEALDHTVENLLRKGLSTCRKADNRMTMMMMMMMIALTSVWMLSRRRVFRAVRTECLNVLEVNSVLTVPVNG